MATIKDIAKLARVSTATVSRVLADKTSFYTEETAIKVRKAAEELGYQKNTAAMELVTKKSNVIAVIVESTKSNFSNQIITGIQTIAYKQNLNVIILYAGINSSELQRKSLQTVIERSVMGILLLAINLSFDNLNLLKNSRIPFFFLAVSFQKGTIPFISSDDFQIGYQATKYLISQGHKKIGFAGADFDISYTGKLRLLGYQQALKENNLPSDKNWIKLGNYSYEAGLQAMKDYGKKNAISAIIANSDLVAIGIINQAAAFGLSIPSDISVISVDGTDFCSIFRPQITSVSQSFYEMGVLGTEYLLNQRDNSVEKRFTPIEIKQRDSVKCLS